MISKARIESDLQRQRIAEDSVFGIWVDTQNTIRVRISPIGNSIRIRIVQVIDLSVIDVIYFFCGIATTPKRSKWTHFDLVTNLLKHPYLNSYIWGEVHLPRAYKKAGVSLTIQEKIIQLNFFNSDSPDVSSGSIVFHKDPAWHNRGKKRKSPAPSL